MIDFAEAAREFGRRSLDEIDGHKAEELFYQQVYELTPAWRRAALCQLFHGERAFVRFARELASAA